MTTRTALIVIIVGLLAAAYLDGQDAALAENAVKTAQVQQ